MLEELLDHLVGEKMDWKEYSEIADEMDEGEIKDMFKMIAEDEHKHYKMIKEYLSRFMRED